MTGLLALVLGVLESSRGSLVGGHCRAGGTLEQWMVGSGDELVQRRRLQILIVAWLFN